MNKENADRPRRGARLADGAAHACDHALWSRREFIARLGLAGVGGLTLGGTPVQALASATRLGGLAGQETNRVLVLLQLVGGNDGLNTIVPYQDDEYYRLRGNLAIAADQILPLDQHCGLHPSLAPLWPLWEQRQMGVVHSVGYPEPQLSHFRSKDIWDTASQADQYLDTGWGGRFVDGLPPEPQNSSPLAVQIGGGSSLIFKGGETQQGISLSSPEAFERLAEEGTVFPLEGLPDNPLGREIGFVRRVANDSFVYAEAIQEAANRGANQADYANNDAFTRGLGVAARLIKGGLGAKIYLVQLGGFDTHSNQVGQHASLLGQLAAGVRDFSADLAAGGRSEEVVMMTFSEFGRRVQANASRGTDHGAAAPVFMFGAGLRGGLEGAPPLLSDLDERGNLSYQVDFRRLYATLFGDWFGLELADTRRVLGGDYKPLPFLVSDRSTAVSQEAVETDFTLAQNWPNPFNPRTQIRYVLGRAARVRLQVYNAAGQVVARLVDEAQAVGQYQISFDGAGLASGVYFYQLEAEGLVQRRKMLLQK
ncbi:MAG: DUF1501 domain-containing protein [Candidatus Latescibacteria bacterium]|nr:DUF1501 domain-containing protein [Candidatus Latescibacterota bacterium]